VDDRNPVSLSGKVSMKISNFNSSPDDDLDIARLMRLATYGAVSVASFLVLFKFGAWIANESLSLLSTLIDSFLDMWSKKLGPQRSRRTHYITRWMC
jgi:hypothetical protein